MASRIVYAPQVGESPGVASLQIDFTWYAGMSKAQKQRSIKALHDVAHEKGIWPLLEISTKSTEEIGVELSAFNLCITTKLKGKKYSVEAVYQGSKVFDDGGPYFDIFTKSPRMAKRDSRLIESGRLRSFSFFGKMFPLNPKTYFYDWIYINALEQNRDLASVLMGYSGFSDIEFNPVKSVNCQAHSAALYVSLRRLGLINAALESPESFLSAVGNYYQIQMSDRKLQRSLI